MLHAGKHPPEAIQKAVVPILIARQLLTGAGKVGAETGDPCDFQLSQRADHLSELCNLETLWRRPSFNTRDEPHAERYGHEGAAYWVARRND